MLDAIRFRLRRRARYETIDQVVESLPEVGIIAPISPGADPIGATGDDAAGAATHKRHPELGSFKPRHERPKR